MASMCWPSKPIKGHCIRTWSTCLPTPCRPVLLTWSMIRIEAWTKGMDGWNTASIGRFPTPRAWPISIAKRPGRGCAALAWETAERKVGEQVSSERRYYITSLAGNARAFGGAVRSRLPCRKWSPLGARYRLSRRRQSHAQGSQPAELCGAATYGAQPPETGADGHVWHQSSATQSRME